ncbi:MAG: hypothetical protein NTV51_04605, partial [Verrucomicrobia bacterium]|nr:hypothetical protein [Verrucomicrobiota bacterium]
SAPAVYTLRAAKPGAWPFTLDVTAGPFRQKIAGALVVAKWHAVFFPWTKDTDPRKDMEAYRKSLVRRADPSAGFLQGVQAKCRDVQRRQTGFLGVACSPICAGCPGISPPSGPARSG